MCIDQDISSIVKDMDVDDLIHDIQKVAKTDVYLAEEIVDSALYEKGIEAGLSKEVIEKFNNLLKGDIKYDVEGTLSKEYSKMWDLFANKQKEAYAITELSQELGKAVAVKNKLTELDNFMEYKRRYDLGDFRSDKYTLDDILNFKLDARTGNLSDIEAKDYSNIKGRIVLPRADEFISDEAVVNYVKELCSDNSALQKCKNLQEVADELNKNPVKLNLVTFQNPSKGAKMLLLVMETLDIIALK